MRLRMQRCDQRDELEHGTWELAIVGRALDDRGRHARQFSDEFSRDTVLLEYDPQELRLHSEGEAIECDDLAAWIAVRRPDSLLLDSTTLGFAEIALCCKVATVLQFAPLSLLYVEPMEYFTPRGDSTVHRRDFDLSDEIPGYSAIPGSALLLDETLQQEVVFFLGYEGHRLDRAFEELSLAPRYCSAVLGVPAFQPGWEMDTFANNVRVIGERRMQGGIAFCGADNPAAALELLLDRRRAKGSDEDMFVAPIGTKPHGIGAALFAAMFDNVGVLYDHPQRRAGRTAEISHWHLFDVDFSVST